LRAYFPSYSILLWIGFKWRRFGARPQLAGLADLEASRQRAVVITATLIPDRVTFETRGRNADFIWPPEGWEQHSFQCWTNRLGLCAGGGVGCNNTALGITAPELSVIRPLIVQK
jgi:hypothetical protein